MSPTNRQGREVSDRVIVSNRVPELQVPLPPASAHGLVQVQILIVVMTGESPDAVVADPDHVNSAPEVGDQEGLKIRAIGLREKHQEFEEY